ncbi:hypothetical protein IM40_02275 [Candidatus Paracaedimonas acanthamoebae]|nr:hypothetical protein IM40_02275 [Candidatus Paracaedimonas acanthamoebae]
MEKKKLLSRLVFPLFLSLLLSLKSSALCPKERPHAQTCRIQKLSMPEEKTPTVLVFASFSMPQATIKKLASDLKKIGGALVIQGLIKNSFKETALTLQKLGEDVLLDPTLFEKFNVTSVPTFIIFEGDLKDDHFIYDRLAGNVSLRFALEKVTQEGDIKSTHLLLEKLTGSKS